MVMQFKIRTGIRSGSIFRSAAFVWLTNWLAAGESVRNERAAMTSRRDWGGSNGRSTAAFSLSVSISAASMLMPEVVLYHREDDVVEIGRRLDARG